METVNYESMLLAITYLEALNNKDEEQQKIVLESSNEHDLFEGMVLVSKVMMQWSVHNAQGRYSTDDLIRVARDVALDKAFK